MVVVVTSLRKGQFAGDAREPNYVSDGHRQLGGCLLYPSKLIIDLAHVVILS